jgi:hypothetical protein
MSPAATPQAQPDTLALSLGLSVLVDGQWSTGGDAPLSVHNPVTGEPITRLHAASLEQVDAAVTAAARALPSWRDTTPAGRGQWLAGIADAIEAQRPLLEALQRLNNGKPALEAGLDVSDAVATFRYYADLCAHGEGLLPQAVALPDEGFQAELAQVPVGVVGLIVPWNFPMVTTAWKLAPALAAGCTVVLKPSELTPLAELAMQAIVQGTGLPKGVVNVVYGAAATGQALVQHPGVAKVSFTGSNATGQRILQACGPRMQRLSLELGGKSSLIVLDDADLDLAIELAVGLFQRRADVLGHLPRVRGAPAVPALCGRLRQRRTGPAAWRPRRCGHQPGATDQCPPARRRPGPRAHRSPGWRPTTHGRTGPARPERLRGVTHGLHRSHRLHGLVARRGLRPCGLCAPHRP